MVGASLGGIDALKVVLGGLPARFPCRSRSSSTAAARGGDLRALLQRYSALPVVDAEDKDAVVPGGVYLAPAGYHLLVEPGSFALSVDAPVVYARPSIDVLFESAADGYGAASIGVVLTGTGADGAAGPGPDQAARRAGDRPGPGDRAGARARAALAPRRGPDPAARQDRPPLVEIVGPTGQDRPPACGTRDA